MKRVLATGGAGGGAEEVESVQIDPHDSVAIGHDIRR